MNKVIIYFILLFCLSCNQAKESAPFNSEEGINVIIDYPIGDIVPDFDMLKVPAFFNIGHIENRKDSFFFVLVLGERLSKDTKISVLPLNNLTYEREGRPMHFLVSYPLKSSNGFYKDLNSYALMELDQMIENWYRMQCPLGECLNFKWTNTFKSILNLDNKKKEVK